MFLSRATRQRAVKACAQDQHESERPLRAWPELPDQRLSSRRHEVPEDECDDDQGPARERQPLPSRARARTRAIEEV